MHIFSAEYLLGNFTEGEPVAITPEQLETTEDILVHSLLPLDGLVGARSQSNAELNWEHRKRLIDGIRGTKYNGRLSDIVIEPMPDPCGLLAEERPALVRKPSREGATNMLGFFVCADLISSLSSDLGKLRRPVWVVRKSPDSIIGTGVAWKRTIGKDQGENAIEEAFRRSVHRAGQYHIGGGSYSKHSSRRQILDDGQTKSV